MIKNNKKTTNKKNNLHQHYSDSDLNYFNILNDFSNLELNLSQPKKIQTIVNPIKYKTSDNKKFKKIINLRNGQEKDNKEETKKYNSIYNKSDLEKFNTLKEFSFLSSSYSLEKVKEKKEESTIEENHYKSADLLAFSQIIDSNQENKKINLNDHNKNPETKIDKTSIKIIDFDKFQKKKKIINNQIREKIKVVYFD